MSPLIPSPSSFLYEGQVQGVTNYSVRAEKVVWALPSGTAMLHYHQADCRYAATTAGTAASAQPGLYRLREVQTLLMPERLAGPESTCLLTCWAELIRMSRLPGNFST
ncbi:hypothetical protein CesoFtcFv8_009340 [Champsocephalus esox]|uniref:Uncharacterized protein n=1 Tax=Champsocephalus esox TaxID=159716 RepID=A0AAN8CDA7_9TELE|nr:hypothetical protein CesoFtcFv8_009340 [Champsocephalus esox]